MSIYQEASRRGAEFEKAGRFEEALEAYAEMMGGTDEEQIVSYLQRTRLLDRLRRFEESLALHRIVVELAPDFEELSVSLYCALLRCGRFDEAVAEAKRFFEGRLNQPHSNPLVEGHRENIVRLLNMSEDDYEICKQRLLEDPVTIVGGVPDISLR